MFCDTQMSTQYAGVLLYMSFQNLEVNATSNIGKYFPQNLEVDSHCSIKNHKVRNGAPYDLRYMNFNLTRIQRSHVVAVCVGARMLQLSRLQLLLDAVKPLIQKQLHFHPIPEQDRGSKVHFGGHNLHLKGTLSALSADRTRNTELRRLGFEVYFDA